MVTWQLFSGTHLGKHRHSLGVHATGGFCPQWCHLLQVQVIPREFTCLAMFSLPWHLIQPVCAVFCPFSAVYSLLWQVSVPFLILQGVEHYR